MGNLFSGLRVGPAPYVQGQLAVHQREAARHATEELAAQTDERRRLEAFRRAAMSDPTITGLNQAPSYGPGEAMPPAQVPTQSGADADQEAFSGITPPYIRGRHSGRPGRSTPVSETNSLDGIRDAYTETDLQNDQALASRLRSLESAGLITLQNRGRGVWYVQRNRDRIAATDVGQRIGSAFGQGNIQNYGLAPGYSGVESQPQISSPSALQATSSSPGANAIAQIFGSQVTSAQRNPQHNAEVGGVPNSMHLSGQAVDITIPQSMAGMSRQQREAAVRQQLAQAFPGFNPSEVIDEGDHIHIGWRPEGDQGQGQTFAADGALDLSELVNFNPAQSSGIGNGYDIRSMNDQRNRISRLAELAMQTGNVSQGLQLQQQLAQMDLGLSGALIERAIQAFDVTGDSRYLASVMSEYVGAPVQFQQTEGQDAFAMFVGGNQVTPPMSREDIGMRARTMFSAEFRNQQAEIARESNRILLQGQVDRSNTSQRLYEENTYRLGQIVVQGQADLAVAVARQNGGSEGHVVDVGGESVVMFRRSDGLFAAPLRMVDRPRLGGGGSVQEVEVGSVQRVGD